MRCTKPCAKCQRSMTEGFVIDNTYGARGVSSWLEGAPVKSIWMGVKLEGRKPIEITTWRCDGCGYLESYAPPPR